MQIIQPIVGICVFILIAYLLSTRKRSISWRLVFAGLALQGGFCVALIYAPVLGHVLKLISKGFVLVLDFSLKGAVFLFGDLSKNSGIDASAMHNMGFIFAFQVLPTIVFFSGLTAGLYYLGILQRVVYGIAWVMSKTMRLSGTESLSAAGNIFLGQTEAPLLVRPYINRMTNSELFCMMTVGMATIAGGVMAAYIAFLGGDDPASRVQFATHLLTASVMNAPGAIVLSKIIYPEVDKINTKLYLSGEKEGVNLIDAIANGTLQGMKLAANVGAMVLVFVSLIYMVNYFFEWIGAILQVNDTISTLTEGTYDKLSMQFLLGQLYRPLAYLMGVDWSESLLVGSLLGQKTVINEFLSYYDLSIYKNQGLLSQKSVLISTFALCGFSNFSSIAIQIGGIGALAPEKRSLISKLGIRSLIGATLACFISGSLAGLIIR